MSTPRPQTDFAVLSDPVIFPSIKGSSSSALAGNVPDFRSEKVSEFFILPRIKENSAKVSPRINDQRLSDFNPEDDYDFDQDEDDRKPAWSLVPRNLKQSDVIKGYYRKACERENVLPLARFLDQIGDDIITLKDVGFTRKAFKAICACLVVLADNNINGQALAILSHHIISNRNLKLFKLDLSGNKITDDDGKSISNIIQNNSSLQELCLARNELQEHGPIMIAKALGENDNLDILDVSWNHIRGPGAVALSNGVSVNTNLRVFNAAWNGFGYEGSLAMGHALLHNSTLLELDLSNNRIHPPALFNFMSDMLKNKTLLTLKLGYNPIPVYYTCPLLTLIAKCKTMALTLLDLSGLVVDTEFEQLLDNLRSKRDITVLYDKSLPIHRDKWSQLMDESNDGPDVINVDPVRLLYLLKQNLRCIDMLVQMDKDDSFDLSRTEIRKALDKHGVPVSSSAMDMIMKYLDTNRDGAIDLSELIDGERRVHRDLLNRKAAQKANPNYVDTTVYSQTFQSGGIKGLAEAVEETMKHAENAKSVEEHIDESNSKI
ncbi:leucine-rich repeat-containing protein 74B-like [Liolophura sinensis]|uniref:leucine-rich repeat-containing protein 74B-like n=1 Tax=Liolophura sinensis TaxID=3198878 RepID=UPI003158C7E1